jgi:hypothetical protein
MPRLASRLVSVLCVFALFAASAAVTATVILWPRSVAAIASRL